ncbi:MAG: hypothetical protein WBV85_09595 [Solirubrobacteraceae bacterium]
MMFGVGNRTVGRSLVAGLVVAVAIAALFAGQSLAASGAAPGWGVTPATYPSHIAPGSKGYILIPVYNIGAAPSSGAVTVTDRLPAGLTAIEAGYSRGGRLFWNCQLGAVVTCVNNPSVITSIPPGEPDYLDVVVEAAANVSGEAENEITVSGGGALAPTATTNTIDFESKQPGFGLQSLDGWFSNPDGTLDTQAGSHPYSLNISFFLNNEEVAPIGEARDVTVDLPPGLIGNPQVLPRCTRAQFNVNHCPPETQVGMNVANLVIGPTAVPISEGGGEFLRAELPVYNLVPPPGVPSELGFSFFGFGTRLATIVRSGSDYGLRNNVKNIIQLAISYNSITIWGSPGDPSHDYQRCGYVQSAGANACEPVNTGGQPFLTLPTSCRGPELFSAVADSWAPLGTLNGGIGELSFRSHGNSGLPEGLSGCDHLAFTPSIGVAPDTTNADTPAGATVDVKVLQDGLTDPQGLAMSNIKNTTVTLPEGMVINPGQAAGLAACQQEQSAVGTEAAPSCPSASKVGTDQIETPLLAHKLEGDVYVLQSNPPNLKLLVAASGEGVNLKLVGNVHLDETTGRIVTTFTETPELPFTDFKLSFSGGAQAALATPLRCGSYTTSSDFTPWTTPDVEDAFPTSEFLITHGTGGSACAGPTLPFNPSLTAGSTTDQAGGFTNFSLLLTREDGQQRIGTLQFKTPQGLLGMISKVPLCPEPQAAEGTCSSASQIGHTVVEAGPGPYPLVVPQPGQPPAPIYLTGGYKGAPYGLSIVVPLVVGPFTLRTQVVRARIEVDPITTQLTVTTDPLPSIIDGIPADLRAINAVIDKPGFMFNPTGCEPGSFSGTATSSEGASVPIGSHFQMGSCRSLTFKPNFKVSTSGKTSRKDGASLDAKILYPTGELGDNQASSQSNVKAVKVDLPKQLPSRLTTLQKACPSATFEANPASCPEDSRVGSATAITPVLPVTLTGPAYFVSYGGAKFPELVVVLQGYGVTVFLHGETFISKAGITSSTFRNVPDVPITSFELKLPEGPFSALAANGNLCATKLKMPTAFTGQNGAVLKQSTPISVTGCVKHKAKAKKKPNQKKAGHKKSGKGK